MLLVTYDIATEKPRRVVERALRELGLMFLFRNARWTSRPVDVRTLTTRLRGALRGQTFRVLVIDLPRRSMLTARWLHGPGKERTG